MAQRKRNIEFARPDEPAFLKKLKSKIGFQNSDQETLETKKEKLIKDDLYDRDDEEPVYVIPDNSSVTDQEVDAFKNKIKEEKEFKEDCESLSKRIIFKKPTNENKNSEPNEGMHSIQSTKKLESQRKNISKEIQSNSKSNQIKSVKNSRLLSFGDDEDESEEF